jgi:hypothetical protein
LTTPQPRAQQPHDASHVWIMFAATPMGLTFRASDVLR